LGAVMRNHLEISGNRTSFGLETPFLAIGEAVAPSVVCD